MWGVQAASMRRHEITEALIADAARRVVELGWVKPGARVGITAGPAQREAGHDQPDPDPARLGWIALGRLDRPGGDPIG